MNQEEVLLPNTSLIGTIGVQQHEQQTGAIKTKEQKLMVNSVEGCRQLEQRNITNRGIDLQQQIRRRVHGIVDM